MTAQLRQIMNNELQKKKKKQKTKGQLPLLKSWEQKQGTVHACYTQHHRRDGQTN